MPLNKSKEMLIEDFLARISVSFSFLLVSKEAIMVFFSVYFSTVAFVAAPFVKILKRDVL